MKKLTSLALLLTAWPGLAQTLTKVTLPSAITGSLSAIRGLGGYSDGLPGGKIYLGTSNGVYVGDTAQIQANPNCTGCWTTLNTGLPAATSGADPFNVAANYTWSGGKMIAVIRDYTTAFHDKVCYYDTGGATWNCSGSYPAAFDTSTSAAHSLATDASGGIYFASGDGIYKSTNQGATWSTLCVAGTGCFTWQPTFWTLDVIGNQIYFGGDGPAIGLHIAPLNMSSKVDELPGPTYTHNPWGTISDGDAGTAPASEIITLMSGSSGAYCQQKDVVAGTWSTCNNVSFPSGAVSTFWTNRWVRKGINAHEYFMIGGGTNSGTGVMRRAPGTTTWTTYGDSVATTANNGSAFFYLEVDSDGSVWTARQQGGSPGNGTELWFVAAPTVSAPGASSSSIGLRTGTTIIH